MGVIGEAQQKERDTPELPACMIDIYARYKRLRFGLAELDDAFALIPRDPLTHSEIESFSALTHWQPSPSDVDIIMDIDAIFNSREI